tara:strand:+ start:583 stop:930 length:348 start_codon:yes stop_codon:yes gene_type:complete
MIETNEPTNGEVVKQETPAKITTTMIIEDLENGISRNGIKEKYSLETWEVTQMFQHPKLKGKKTKKVRKLSFEFVDDTVPNPNQTDLETIIEQVEQEEALTSFEEDEEEVTEVNN